MPDASSVSPYVAAAAQRANIQHRVVCGQCGASLNAVATADELHGNCPKHGQVIELRAHAKVAAFEALAERYPEEREQWKQEAAQWRERADQERAAEAATQQATG